MTKKTLWFAGTPEFAAHSLDVLIQQQGYHVAAVLTQPDRPAGRGRKLTSSAVKMTAKRHGIAVEQPEKIQQYTPPFPKLPRPDLIVVAAYGLLLPQWFLDFPRLGCINIHASLLPRWRGAAPIQRAIEAGDKETGVAIMQMDKGLDTGAVWLEKRMAIDEQSAVDLLEQLTKLGGQALLEALPIVFSNSHKPLPQNKEGVTYAHKLTKAEAKIHWQESAEEIVRKIRAFDLYPVAFSTLEEKNIRFFSAQAVADEHDYPAGYVIAHHKNGIDIVTGQGVLRVKNLQFPGKAKTTAAELRNGYNLTGVQFL